MKIVKVAGVNGLGKTNGCEKAPDEILKELNEIHSNEQGKVLSKDVFDVEDLELDNLDLEKDGKLIYDKVFEILDNSERVVFLGGDHSISYSSSRAFLDNCENKGAEPCLIVFDAHADCMTPMKEPTHEEWLRKLIEDGFPVENILLIGARNLWKDEIEFLKKKNVKQISMNQLLDSFEDSCEAIMEFSNGKELYVSIDIDFIDPAYAPGTGYPEVGGLSSRKFIYLISRISKMKNLKAVDLVEINPVKDKGFDNRTVKLGAKILGELV